MTTLPRRYQHDAFSFQFPSGADRRLTLCEWTLRTDDVYSVEAEPEKLVLDLLRLSLQTDEYRSCFMFATSAQARSAVRTRKGALWNTRELKRLASSTDEVDNDGSTTRLCAVVPLSACTFQNDSNVLLNWTNGIFVVGRAVDSESMSLALNWVAKKQSCPLSFDFDAMGEFLATHEDVGVLRYLCPDNGRNELLVAVGAEAFFLRCKIENQVQLALSGSRSN